MARMSKEEKAQAELIEVNSWDEWFRMCGTIAPELSIYQTRVWNYHDFMLGINERDRVFRDHHNREFWKNDRPIAGKHLVLAAKIAAGIFVLALFGLTIFFCVTRREPGVGPLDLIGGALSDAAIMSCVIAVVTLVLVVGACILRRLSMISWFKKKSPRLASALRYVPPRYRNSFCLDTLYRVYVEYDVTSFAVAVDTLDIHIKNNADSYVPIRVFFDVPYSQADDAIEAGSSNVDLDEGGDPVVTSEALPSDIKSHTHEGVDDAERALDELIGLKNVKDQVRQMKRRIEFYDGKGGGQSGDNVMLLGPAGSGKALDNNTPIAVNDARGYVRIADIEVGDEVFDEAGQPTRVLGVYPQGSIDAIRVSFTGGSSLVCNGEHIFTARREGEDWQDITVAEMMAAGGAWFIPQAKAIEREDMSFVDAITLILDEDLLLGSLSDRKYFVDTYLEKYVKLTALGMESVEFDNPSHAKLFATLAASVGYRSGIATRAEDSGMVYYVNVERPESGELDDMTIIGFEDLGKEVPMTCIYVEAESHLYQAGHYHIVTHNTEVARILTRIFYDFGYIKKNRIVEVDGEYLKSPYIGQTGERTSAIVEWAMGGVLFVDEAYLLFNEKDNSSVGAEATGVLLKAMEDHRDEFVVIFAGYEDAMNRLIASNEGFASRVKHKLYFDMYTPAELVQIFELFLKKAGQHVNAIEDEARELLEAEFEAESKLPGFGNARSARNACDALLDIHADRYIEGVEAPENKGIITVGDVEAFIDVQKEKFASDGRNFMAQNHIDQSIVSMSELKSRTRKGSANWKKSMDALVGLEKVKSEIVAFKERADFFRETKVDDSDTVLNLQFVGEAGTGKTSVASIVTGLLYDAGYIRENRYLDISGDFFKASYVGQTGKRTQAIIEYSKGMVLFIDEAYLLSASGGGGGHDFGAEAIGVLVDAMEKSRGEMVVIFAGYEREMRDLMDVNTGLSSRIAQTMHFERYSMRELMLIFSRMADACSRYASASF